MMPWLILGVVNSFFFRVETVCSIVGIFRGFFRGERLVTGALAHIGLSQQVLVQGRHCEHYHQPLPWEDILREAFEGEVVIVDDALAVVDIRNSFSFSGSSINGDIEQLAYSAREFRKVNEGVVCLKGNLGVLILVVSLLSLKV